MYNYINITTVVADRGTEAGGQRAERSCLKPIEDMNVTVVLLKLQVFLDVVLRLWISMDHRVSVCRVK